MEPPKEIIKLVKMILSLPHGQAAVESGFSTTKYIVDKRTFLNDVSVKGQKLVTSAVRAEGGAHNVPVTTSLLRSVKDSNAKYDLDMAKQKENKRKAEEDFRAEADAKKIREEKELEKVSWDRKKTKIDDEIKVVEREIKMQNDLITQSLDQLKRANNNNTKEACFNTIEQCRASINSKTKLQKNLQESLATLMLKKPK